VTLDDLERRIIALTSA